MKIIYKSRDITEAHIVSGMLQANGIKAYVGGHYLQGGVGDLAAMDFANVQVADDDVSPARLIIAEYDNAPTETETMTEVEGVITKETTLGTKIVTTIFVVVIITSLFILISR